jgi:hypothetical protein
VLPPLLEQKVFWSAVRDWLLVAMIVGVVPVVIAFLFCV